MKMKKEGSEIIKDRKNILFLAIGVLLSVVSKLLQFVYQAKIGDFIVIPAAVFFVLAILHSLPAFKALYRTAQGARQANIMATLACSAVVSFQIMMILIIGNSNWLGLLLLVPFIAMGALFGVKWFQNIVKSKG
ncbi:hypothetical protein LNN31_02225 [Acetobacterium wieringae]|uniref:Uncharacterized protein n=1 Tax=Acetobacterium wieringae TaxID=52694 RepID=A0ABY6HFH6_9FIRM|nr:hypothetical protein [Acetobacterium wieringae]UYO63282.1 hypothetical protein LNN31_02225 [Acetobacterium wieringae]